MEPDERVFAIMGSNDCCMVSRKDFLAAIRSTVLEERQKIVDLIAKDGWRGAEWLIAVIGRLQP